MGNVYLNLALDAVNTFPCECAFGVVYDCHPNVEHFQA